MLIGCLGGGVYDWMVGKDVKKLFDRNGSVIIMRWSHNRKVS